MEADLKRILTTVLGGIAFMFLALSTIAIVMSGRVFEDPVELAGASAKESVSPAFLAGTGSQGTLDKETLAVVTGRRIGEE